MTQSHFKPIQSRPIDSLNLQYTEYEHEPTGARHIHLAADNTENVFMVALRTVPTNSTGVAHILEHTALCGSEKYPVRDPFFMMIRRSLNTFMNAFTSSDWTAYPFASQNRKDFDNLLNVYLDAVFFAQLDPLDFAQEGHRIEFEKADDPSSPLVYKGVVFNEMKGAMSSISSQLWQAIGASLFPDTTYSVNSGGDPAVIPTLSYEQLQAFYRKHYHPSNAVFMTYGDIPAADHQHVFETQTLQRFSPAEQAISVPKQPRFSEPLRNRELYPLSQDEDSTNKTHMVMAWLLDSITDPLEVMTLHLLSSALLDNSASPLQKALETTTLGTAPSPLCGLDDTSLEMVFVCGLEGVNSDAVDDFEQLVLNTLRDIADNGVDSDTLASLLDQLELQQREISGDSYPYGLQIMLSALPSAIHRADPAAALDIDSILHNLRASIADPAYIKQLVEQRLLDNMHRSTVILEPDTTLAEARIADEAASLASIRKQLDDQQIQSIIDTSAALQKRQNQHDDPSILPKVTLDDIPADIPVPSCSDTTIASRRCTFYPQGTNGLTYQQIIVSLPALDQRQQQLLSLHNRLLTEMGVGELDYLATQQWQSRVSGGIHAYSAIRGSVDDEQAISGHFVLSAKGLAQYNDDIAALMHTTLLQPRFNEHDRIRELIAQARGRAEQSISGNGHGLAMSIACQRLSPGAKLSYSTSGMLGIQNLKALDDSFADPDNINAFGRELANTHQQLLGGDIQLLQIGEENQRQLMQNSLESCWSPEKENNHSKLTLDPCREQTRELWIANTQVNFCAKAYPTVTGQHEDAAPLTVLGGVLRNGYLHSAIREQGGAYGAGASQDSAIAAFRFYSYRDPRLGETLDDFDQSLNWLLESAHDHRIVEEAILGVIGSIDKPSSPAGTAKQHYHNELFGRSVEQQREFRRRILAVTLDDICKVAEKYLTPKDASIGIVTHRGEEQNIQHLREHLDLNIFTL